MKLTRKAIALMATFGALAVPTIVPARDMDPSTATCAQFMALDGPGMLAAVNAMHAASADAATAMDEAAQLAIGATATVACDANPDMLAKDAMKAK